MGAISLFSCGVDGHIFSVCFRLNENVLKNLRPRPVLPPAPETVLAGLSVCTDLYIYTYKSFHYIN